MTARDDRARPGQGGGLSSIAASSDGTAAQIVHAGATSGLQPATDEHGRRSGRTRRPRKPAPAQIELFPLPDRGFLHGATVVGEFAVADAAGWPTRGGLEGRRRRVTIDFMVRTGRVVREVA